MRCDLCWEPLTAQTKDEHHKIKRSKGGQDFKSNTVFICTRCHRLIHTAELLLRKGRSTEVVQDFFRSTLSPIHLHREIEETVQALYAASKDAAFLEEHGKRVLQPFEVKAPVDMLQKFTLLARDLNVSRNDLVLWCMRAALDGRLALPS